MAKCENPPTVRRFWPGREPDLVCLVHALESEAIAQHMGFHLHQELFEWDSKTLQRYDIEDLNCACEESSDA